MILGKGDDEPKADVVVHAQTGSGKTLAFLLPLFALLEPSRSAVQALVVVPTRELALQVGGECIAGSPFFHSVDKFFRRAANRCCCL